MTDNCGTVHCILDFKKKPSGIFMVRKNISRLYWWAPTLNT